MFYFLSTYLKDTLFFANVFHYTSFRAIAAFLTALLVALIFGDRFIRYSGTLFFSGPREFTPETHQTKNKVPTMGGIFIIASFLVAIAFWADWANPLVWAFVLCMTGFGAIGFWDDWKKITQGKGVSAFQKFIAQWSMAALVCLVWIYYGHAQTTISFPFFKHMNIDIGLFFILWAMFVIVSCSNAVNLTDGLDGLAISCLMPNILLYSLLAYLAGHFIIALYLHIPFAQSSEVAVLGAALIGSAFGFFWYNAYPAQVFMGDVGSLSLGACLALMALMAKQEVLLVISGGIFIAETVSVMLQIFTYKRWKKRIFKMAPLHHHFELIGWPESKITTRFSIISVVLCLLALVTIKLR